MATKPWLSTFLVKHSEQIPYYLLPWILFCRPFIYHLFSFLSLIGNGSTNGTDKLIFISSFYLIRLIAPPGLQTSQPWWLALIKLVTFIALAAEIGFILSPAHYKTKRPFNKMYLIWVIKYHTCFGFKAEQLHILSALCIDKQHHEACITVVFIIPGSLNSGSAVRVNWTDKS